MSTHEAKLAWAAGFFDGEGCVGCYKSKGMSRRSAYIVACIKQTHQRWLSIVKLRQFETALEMYEVIHA